MDDVKRKRSGRSDEEQHANPTSVPVGYTPEALSDVHVVDEDEPLLGQTVAQKYRIERKIGQGGMGEVYLAINPELGQRVAIKFLSRKLAHDEGLVARFLNEARSYCKVNHPNAVTLLEYGQHESGTLYIITEFVEGKNLGETLKDHGTFSMQQVIQVALQLCEVLAAAHKQGVIHRDLKPDNVMLMPVARGRYAVKVLDFGIAKIVDDDQDGPTTETGSVFGTPEFMSPEQARGDGADPRSDIYALGIILFFMVTGKLPFRGKNKLAVLNKQLNEAPPRPSEVRPEADIPPRLEAVIMKCLNKSARGRYATAEDLHEALEELTVPAGAHTAKVKAVDSGAPDTPVERPITPKAVKAPTVRLGGDEGEAGFAETLASLDEAPNLTELDSIDISRERITDLPASGASRDHKVVIGTMAVVGLLMAGLFFGLSGRQDAQPELDVQQVLVVGQVMGVLATLENTLETGNVEEARKSLNQTFAWVPAGQLPVEAEATREALGERLGKLEVQREAFLAAIRANDCAAAQKIQQGLLASEEGLANRLRYQLRRCEGARSSAQPPPEPAPRVEPKATSVRPPAVETKPPVKPANAVPPKSNPAVAPAEGPPKGEGDVSKTAELAPSESDVTEPKAVGETATQGINAPDGLPPKTIE